MVNFLAITWYKKESLRCIASFYFEVWWLFLTLRWVLCIFVLFLPGRIIFYHFSFVIMKILTLLHDDIRRNFGVEIDKKNTIFKIKVKIESDFYKKLFLAIPTPKFLLILTCKSVRVFIMTVQFSFSYWCYSYKINNLRKIAQKTAKMTKKF